MRSCGHCGGKLDMLARADARFCSTRCRVAAHRSRRALPSEMTARRSWVRRDGKRPVTVTGESASSTKSSTWSSYGEAVESQAGNGLGVMLGSGLGCYDLDHCITDGALTTKARAFISGISERIVWVERSMSGTGLHIFIEAPEASGWKRDGVERYTRRRFIAVTADAFVI